MKEVITGGNTPNPELVAAFWATTGMEPPTLEVPVPQVARESYQTVRDRVFKDVPEGFRHDQGKRPRQVTKNPKADHVVNGLTGEVTELPEGKRAMPKRPKRQTQPVIFCPVCLRKLTKQERYLLDRKGNPKDDLVRVQHRHDPQRQIDQRFAALPGNGKPPLNLNSKHKPRRRPKQRSQFQGLAGRRSMMEPPGR